MACFLIVLDSKATAITNMSEINPHLPDSHNFVLKTINMFRFFDAVIGLRHRMKITATVTFVALTIFLASCQSLKQPTPPIQKTTVPDTNAEVTPSDSIESEISATAETEAKTSWINECYSKRQRIAQLITVLLSAGEIQSVKSLVDNGELGFIGLVGKHNRSIANSLKQLQQGAPIPVLVGSDEESRYVQRLSAAIRPLPTTAEMIRLSENEIRQLYAGYGQQMKALGITINFAPVLDVGYGPGIGTRAYGETPEEVIAFGRAVISGLQDAGVMQSTNISQAMAALRETLTITFQRQNLLVKWAPTSPPTRPF